MLRDEVAHPHLRVRETRLLQQLGQLALVRPQVHAATTGARRARQRRHLDGVQPQLQKPTNRGHTVRQVLGASSLPARMTHVEKR